MPAALQRSATRELLNDLVVWFLGFAATGVVFHDVTEEELRALGVRDVAYLVGCIAVVAFGLSYFVFVVPDDYAFGFAAVIGYLLALRLGMWGLQWAGVKVIEARQ